MGREIRTFAQSSDFLQDLFVDLIQSFDPSRIHDEIGFLRWATSVARNNIRDQRRRQQRRMMERLATTFSPAGPRSSSPSSLEIQELENALERLPPDYREVIELRSLDGLSFKELAQRMERASEGAVQMLHARALARLSEAFHHREDDS